MPTTGREERGPGGAPDALEASVGEAFRRSGAPGLSVAVVGGGDRAWTRRFGLADLAAGSSATPATSYLWFSMTKIVTATAVLRLAEEGNLDLDAPVTDYFPDFSIVSQPVQVTSVEMMQRVTPRGGERDFGLGWYRFREAAHRRSAHVEHLGGGAGFWNVMRVYPEESLGVVMMGNSTRYDHETILDSIVRLRPSDRRA